MLSEIAQHFLPKDLSPTTYGLGILQSKSYRILKTATARHLKRHDLTSIDWAILGSLFETERGMGLSDLAEKLDVTLPLITLRTQSLLKKGFLERWTSERDSRSKIVHISLQGKKLIPVIERSLRDAIKPLFKGSSARDLLGFVRVMTRVAQTGKTD